MVEARARIPRKEKRQDSEDDEANHHYHDRIHANETLTSEVE
jgi:hypothetical protein